MEEEEEEEEVRLTAVLLKALRPGRLLPRVRFRVLIFIRGLVDPWVIVRLEGLC
jgi:hypothetical protein